MKRITIITSTFNLIKAGRKETFLQCLESVHNQKYKNYEHIIIDGASTDGTIDILEEYQNKGWITYYSEPDKGIYEAMNKGITKAQGDYIAFLNSDDYYHNNEGFSSVIETFTKKPNAEYVFSDHISLREDTTAKKVKHHLSRVFIRNPFSHQTMFTRTDILKKYGGFNEKYKISADFDLILRMALNNSPCVFTECIFTTFREGGISSTAAVAAQKDKIRIFMENYGITEQQASLLASKRIMPQSVFKKLYKLNHYITFFECLKWQFNSLIKNIILFIENFIKK